MKSMLVSAIVLYAGVTAFIESFKKILKLDPAEYNIFTLTILIAGIIVKFILGNYVKNKGKEVNSNSLVASGSDAFNDGLLSIVGLLLSLIILNQD